MSRKDVFANLGANAAVPPAEARPMKGRVRPILGSPDLNDDPSRSPVGAIGQSLSEVSERSRRADAIEAELAKGLAVVSLDTSDVDPSFIPDRMPGEAEEHERLVASIRDQGQQVPILVRPHPESPGRYQVAFGHRRLAAIAALGRRVNAVVRALSDAELVVAQGQENNERKDLTYIEKARFADRLQRRFSRDVIMSAMSLYKSDLSNMLSVVARIPDALIDAIGAAPGVGRRSWIELADLLARPRAEEKAGDYLARPEVQGLPSADRFKALVSHLKPASGRMEAGVLSGADGTRLAKLSYNEDKVSIVIDRTKAPDFAAFVLDHLEALYAAHRSKD
ncbi:plasmid partitioning protein RepB [Ensifer soli]|uniref:plasmid partitioning protein RepB n=1 Tax=Ciceribacter sp. sgz301302 TaxID=3342379 RepID=UPI0035B6EAB3